MENVNLKRKVTLKRKGDTPGQTPEGKKPNKFIWLAILGVVIIGGIFGLKQFGDKAGEDLPANVQTPAETLVQQDGIVETIANENEQTASDSENDEVAAQNNVSEEYSSSENVVAEKTNTTNSSNDSKSTVSESSPKNNPSNSGKQPSSFTVAGSIDEKAIKVIRGDFGNGKDRMQALGAEYNVIQAKVNEMYKNGSLY
jgi:hypothetical protein